MEKSKDLCLISLMDHIEHQVMITVKYNINFIAFGYFPRPVYEYDDSKELIPSEPVKKYIFKQ